MVRVPKSLDGEVGLAVSRAFKVPGLYRKAESGFLYRLARRRGTVVEIGCWMGRTTSLLVQAASVWGAEVVSVDPFTPMPNGHAQGSADQWGANLRRVGLVPPRLMEMTSSAAAAAWQGELALVFIDGNHTQMAVMHDLRNWTPFVKIGGVVALHDMFYPSIAGVALAVADWWEMDRPAEKEPKWELIGLHDFTIAFKRLL